MKPLLNPGVSKSKGDIMGKAKLLLLSFLILSGCASRMQTGQLQNIAKDWCLVIRASQIIPVYPLTEDLQVGDIFLVQYNVDEQHAAYTEQGFLPLDNMISRIDPKGFYDFYDLSFARDNPQIQLPAEWLSPGKNKSWEQAPTANFPTYSFAVKSGAGINLGIPVQSVPIGLSLLGSDAAQGTITIGEAKTYGLDTITLYQENILPWEKEHRNFLRKFASQEGKKNYIRVVSRVYLAGRMNVTLTTSESQAAGLTVGAPKPVELLTLRSARVKEGVEAGTTEDYAESLKRLNSYIEGVLSGARGKAGEMLPGGTVKIVAASSRGISMEESFRRPLVIGYLGFDMAIDPDGRLGPPIPTHAVLEKQRTPPFGSITRLQIYGNARLSFTYRIIRELTLRAKDDRAISLKEELDSLGVIVPNTYPVPIFSLKPGTDRVVEVIGIGKNLRSDPPTFTDVTRYMGRLRESIAALEKSPGDSVERVAWLEQTRMQMRLMYERLGEHRDIIDRANEYADRF
ncbi:MAG: hypothetical protein JRJ29_19185 [Deltaproteobacteria bacterium]|nr:hypothetical protein [Deltaproteobacteria bacterium]